MTPKPLTRMDGMVGYNDVLSLLRRRTGLDGKQLGWQKCRSQLLSENTESLPASFPDARDNYLMRSWIQDDCPKLRGEAYARYFWDLDSWTEYWDIYRPETHGRYYFGDGTHHGLLCQFLPSPDCPRNPVFEAWKRLAESCDTAEAPSLQRKFESLVFQPQVVEAVVAVDELVLGLLQSHFSNPAGVVDVIAYLDGMERFGKDTLPVCQERYERVPEHDPRKNSSLHHTIEGDIMWFGWAAHLECANLVGRQSPETRELRCLMLAGVALGCSFDFAFRRRRRTRKEYLAADRETGSEIWAMAQECSKDFSNAANEVRHLFRIREYGDD